MKLSWGRLLNDSGDGGDGGGGGGSGGGGGGSDDGDDDRYKTQTMEFWYSTVLLVNTKRLEKQGWTLKMVAAWSSGKLVCTKFSQNNSLQICKLNHSRENIKIIRTYKVKERDLWSKEATCITPGLNFSD